MKVKNFCVIFLLNLLVFIYNLAAAEEKLSSWTFKGFGTLAATGTDSSQIGFYRDKSQTQDADSGWGITPDSRLGLQVSWKASDVLNATVQWVARDHAGNFFEQNLDWAFLRWNLPENLDIRLGRLGVDVFALSDYRNVGYAYLWMRPPHEFYSTIPFYHFDGADVTQKIALDDGRLSMKLYGGYSYNQLPSQTTDLHNLQAPTAGASINFETGDWQARLGYSYVLTLSNPPIQDILNSINSPLFTSVWPDLKNILPSITTRGKENHFSTAALTYDDGLWLSQGEAAYTTSNTLWYPERATAYFSLGRRFSKVTLYSLFGIAKSFQHDFKIPDPLIAIPALLNSQELLHNSLNNNAINEQSISIGTRWDFYENMALKAQWNYYWIGNNNNPQQWQPSTDSIKSETVNVMSAGIDFVF
jgi:hypothetical protein